MNLKRSGILTMMVIAATVALLAASPIVSAIANKQAIAKLGPHPYWRILDSLALGPCLAAHGKFWFLICLKSTLGIPLRPHS